MKQVVKNLPKREFISFDQLSIRAPIGIRETTSGKKYIPSFVLQDRLTTPTWNVSFVSSSNYGWDTKRDATQLMREILDDSRIEVFAFDTLQELAKWLLE
jgi:hypothetical protein